MKFLRLFLPIIFLFLLLVFLFLKRNEIENFFSGKNYNSVQSQSATGIGGEFSLIDQDGKIFSSEKLHGKLSLIYFGFTSCGEVCPVDMANLSKVLIALREKSKDINLVFITIDPERDNPAKIKEFINEFDEKIIGLTSDKESIKKVEKLFKIYASKSADSADSENYNMDHSAFSYLLDKKGKYITHFHHNEDKDLIIEKILEVY